MGFGNAIGQHRPTLAADVSEPLQHTYEQASLDSTEHTASRKLPTRLNRLPLPPRWRLCAAATSAKAACACTSATPPMTQSNLPMRLLRKGGRRANSRNASRSLPKPDTRRSKSPESCGVSPHWVLVDLGPKVPQSGTNSTKSANLARAGQIWAEVDRDCAEFGQFLPESARGRPKLTRSRPNATQVGPKSNKIGQGSANFRANPTRSGPSSTHVGPKSTKCDENSPGIQSWFGIEQIRHGSNHKWPDVEKMRPHATKPKSTKFGPPISANFVQHWPGMGQICLEFGQFWPEVDRNRAQISTTNKFGLRLAPVRQNLGSAGRRNNNCPGTLAPARSRICSPPDGPSTRSRF